LMMLYVDLKFLLSNLNVSINVLAVGALSNI